MDLSFILPHVLSLARSLPALKRVAGSAPEFIEAARSIRPLIQSVKGFADPPTAAELDQLERETFADIDEAIDALGDRPATG